MSRYISRKFIATMAALGSVHWALVERLLDGDAYKAVVIGVVAAYVTSNVAQKATEKK
jgi:hypothetical protein